MPYTKVVGFNFVSRLRSPEAILARLVLAPVLHRKKGISRAYAALIKCWRGSISSTARLGSMADVIRPRLRYCLNCRPAGVLCYPTTNYCGLPYLCPHCYTRYVQGQYKKLAGFFKSLNAAAREGYFLYGYRAPVEFKADSRFPHTRLHERLGAHL